jgi:hypothetical protein
MFKLLISGTPGKKSSSVKKKIDVEVFGKGNKVRLICRNYSKDKVRFEI